MHYCSTRAGVQGRSFRDVLFSGYAADGGMFMPETIPSLSPETLLTWSRLSYQQLLCEICSLYIPEQEIPRHDLEGEMRPGPDTHQTSWTSPNLLLSVFLSSGLISQALSSFSIPEAVSLVQLKDSLSILELFHGETLAFKDLAMSCTSQFLQYFLRKDGKRATILVGMKWRPSHISSEVLWWRFRRAVVSGTSGDTGSSAIRSVLGLSEVDIVVVYPHRRITRVQEQQMTTSIADNVHVFAGKE